MKILTLHNAQKMSCIKNSILLIWFGFSSASNLVVDVVVQFESFIKSILYVAC